MSSFLAKARPRRNSLLEEQKQSCHGLMGTSRNLNAVLESTNDELIKAAAARASEPFYQGHMCSIREDRAHKLCDEQLCAGRDRTPKGPEALRPSMPWSWKRPPLAIPKSIPAPRCHPPKSMPSAPCLGPRRRCERPALGASPPTRQ
eukprot:5881961-Prymnesium_polylepis.1